MLLVVICMFKAMNLLYKGYSEAIFSGIEKIRKTMKKNKEKNDRSIEINQ